MKKANDSNVKNLTKEEMLVMKNQVKEQKRMEKEARKIQKQAEKLIKQDAKAENKVLKKLNKKLTKNILDEKDCAKDIKLIDKEISKYEGKKEIKIVFVKEQNKDLVYKQTLETLYTAKNNIVSARKGIESTVEFWEKHKFSFNK